MSDDWFEQSGGGGAVDVAAFFDSHAAEGVWALVAAGALVSIGTTRDGGALGVTVTVDGRWKRDYFRQPDELGEWISEALPAVKVAVDTARASAERGSRSRRSRGL